MIPGSVLWRDPYKPDAGAANLERVSVEDGRDTLDPLTRPGRHSHTDAGKILLKDVADAPAP